ncbi:MAG TPA: AAA family ATPase [Candidatus Saccharimonadales bacterium]|nr:AAA family ATPase [Candidatus Saccharimonadales bacterium]
MKQDNLFDYQSFRARKARTAQRIGTADFYWLMVSASLAVLAIGLALVGVFEQPAGWLVGGLVGPLLMLVGWSRSLRDIPPASNSSTIDALLDADVLGKLPRNPTPQQLAEIVAELRGGRFFANRFGIAALQNLTSLRAEDSNNVWQEALRLREQIGSPSMSSATVAASLIRTIPGVDNYLAPMRLSADDVTAGASWYKHLMDVVAEQHARRHDGGIGRDWAFGYTPLLEQFGFNISEHITFNGLIKFDLPSHRNIETQMLHLLAQGGRRNVSLVGGLGAGKSTIVRGLAKKLLEADPLVPPPLRYHQIISLDPATLIAESKGRGDLEDLVQHLCYEALRAKNIILFLDDAQLFFEEASGSVNLTNVLMPFLEGGALRIILAMDEHRWLRIAQNTPALAQYLNRIMVTPTDEAETMLVMQDQVIELEYRQKVIYTFQALQATYRLSSRYMSEQVMPGRALKLLEAAANSSEGDLVTHRSVERAIEQTQGVKVSTAESSVERQTLLNLEQLIHQRMINQTRAVQVVSDALRRARAGVRSTMRPIGTFLFLGPTGVGKTELAKSVAAVFFGGDVHLVRIDLNEYSSAKDVSRLIADAVTDPHSLTAQIAKNPFSVVLLDEIEKAHSNVLNTLLQLLDEGILRDINNREVSFRDAIICATSNAGADRIRQHIEAGEKLEQFESQFTDELITANVFRPEFLNRFDEIVLFRPLTPDELVQVIDIILKDINKNLAAQKVSVVVDDESKRLLVQAGYDPRLGARPMRRVVQRVVENIVANQMLAQAVMPGGTVTITAPDVQAMLERSKAQ